MSDSIVVSVPCESREALAVIIDICKEIQLMLYALDEPVFLRGAIAIGQFYLNQDVMFGQAMVDAYLAQEKYSIYPRIIIADSILNNGIVSVDPLNDFDFNGLAEDENDGYDENGQNYAGEDIDPAMQDQIQHQENRPKYNSA